MRLLNTHNDQLKDFISDENRPPYAILSHTWGEDEVSLADWEAVRPGLETRAGYAKVRYCQREARASGLDWIWVDTCCIDKSSSADLSESINSMFRWYREAVVCYAFLSDVVPDSHVSVTKDRFCRSRWFTRGWTLQELLAPSNLLFFGSGWQRLGSKMELLDIIQQITGIEIAYLRGQDLQLASVAKRMSWAAHRKTTRSEDTAYCLLGIFHINMNIRYGEGTRAFYRLQGKIMKTMPFDHTLFAWGIAIDSPASPRPSALHGPREFQNAGGRFVWDWAESREPLMGLLAESPYAFRHSGRFVPNEEAADLYRNAGLGGRLSLPKLASSEVMMEFLIMPHSLEFPSRLLYHCMHPMISQLRLAYWAFLFCGSEDVEPGNRWLVLPLKGFESTVVGRTKYLLTFNDHIDAFTLLSEPKNREELFIGPETQPLTLRSGDILFRRHPSPKGPDTASYMSYDARCTNWRNSALIRTNGTSSDCLTAWCIKTDVGCSRGWIIEFAIDPTDSRTLEVRLVRVCFGSSEDVVDDHGDTWNPFRRITDTGIHFVRHPLQRPLGIWQPSNLPFHLKVVAETVPISQSEFIDVIDVDVSDDEVRLGGKLRFRNGTQYYPPRPKP